MPSQQLMAEEGPLDRTYKGLKHKKKRGLTPLRHPNQDFFLADLACYSLKEDRHNMESPIFTLSTKPDTKIWKWTSADGKRTIEVIPSVKGRATQHDKDILIYLTSQMSAAINRSGPNAVQKTTRFIVREFMKRTQRDCSNRKAYDYLADAFIRLTGTQIHTNIKTGYIRTREGFPLIEHWHVLEHSFPSHRELSIETTLSNWLYRAIQNQEILTLHRDYFRIRSPIARRLYEIARKHCGKQSSWRIDLELLQQKPAAYPRSKSLEEP